MKHYAETEKEEKKDESGLSVSDLRILAEEERKNREAAKARRELMRKLGIKIK